MTEPADWRPEMLHWGTMGRVGYGGRVYYMRYPATPMFEGPGETIRHVSADSWLAYRRVPHVITLSDGMDESADTELGLLSPALPTGRRPYYGPTIADVEPSGSILSITKDNWTYGHTYGNVYRDHLHRLNLNGTYTDLLPNASSSNGDGPYIGGGVAANPYDGRIVFYHRPYSFFPGPDAYFTDITNADPADWTNFSSFCIMNEDGSGATRLTGMETDARCYWSPYVTGDIMWMSENVLAVEAGYRGQSTRYDTTWIFEISGSTGTLVGYMENGSGNDYQWPMIHRNPRYGDNQVATTGWYQTLDITSFTPSVGYGQWTVNTSWPDGGQFYHSTHGIGGKTPEAQGYYGGWLLRDYTDYEIRDDYPSGDLWNPYKAVWSDVTYDQNAVPGEHYTSGMTGPRRSGTFPGYDWSYENYVIAYGWRTDNGTYVEAPEEVADEQYAATTSANLTRRRRKVNFEALPYQIQRPRRKNG